MEKDPKSTNSLNKSRSKVGDRDLIGMDALGAMAPTVFESVGAWFLVNPSIFMRKDMEAISNEVIS